MMEAWAGWLEGLVGWPCDRSTCTRLLRVAWASSQHGAFRTGGFLTWWLRTPKASILGTRQKLHCLLPPSLECHMVSLPPLATGGSSHKPAQIPGEGHKDPIFDGRMVKKFTAIF